MQVDRTDGSVNHLDGRRLETGMPGMEFPWHEIVFEDSLCCSRDCFIDDSRAVLCTAAIIYDTVALQFPRADLNIKLYRLMQP
jgi:hypothetical protein